MKRIYNLQTVLPHILIGLLLIFVAYMGSAQIPESIGTSANDIGKSYTAGTRIITGLPKYFPDTVKNETLFAMDKNNNRLFTWNPKSSRWEVDKIRGNSSSTPRMEVLNSLVFDYTNTILQDSNNFKYYRWDLTANIWNTGLNGSDTLTNYKVFTPTIANVLGYKEIYSGATLPASATIYQTGNKFLLTPDGTEYTYQGNHVWFSNIVKGTTTPLQTVVSGTETFDNSRAIWKNPNLGTNTVNYVYLNNQWQPEINIYSSVVGNFNAVGTSVLSSLIALDNKNTAFNGETVIDTVVNITSNTTLNSNLKFIRGGYFNINPLITLTINGEIFSGDNRIFQCNINGTDTAQVAIVPGARKGQLVKSGWFGVSVDSVGSVNRKNFHVMMNNLNTNSVGGSLPYTIEFNNGTYNFDSTLYIHWTYPFDAPHFYGKNSGNTGTLFALNSITKQDKFIVVYNGTNFSFKDISFTGVTGNHIVKCRVLVFFDYYCSNTHIDNCTFAGASGDVLNKESALLESNRLTSLQLDNMYVTNCRFNSNRFTSGRLIDTNGTKYGFVGMQGNVENYFFTNCGFAGFRKAAIKSVGSQILSVKQCTFLNDSCDVDASVSPFTMTACESEGSDIGVITVSNTNLANANLISGNYWALNNIISTPQFQFGGNTIFESNTILYTSPNGTNNYNKFSIAIGIGMNNQNGVSLTNGSFTSIGNTFNLGNSSNKADLPYFDGGGNPMYQQSLITNDYALLGNGAFSLPFSSMGDVIVGYDSVGYYRSRKVFPTVMNNGLSLGLWKQSSMTRKPAQVANVSQNFRVGDYIKNQIYSNSYDIDGWLCTQSGSWTGTSSQPTINVHVLSSLTTIKVDTVSQLNNWYEGDYFTYSNTGNVQYMITNISHDTLTTGYLGIGAGTGTITRSTPAFQSVLKNASGTNANMTTLATNLTVNDKSGTFFNNSDSSLYVWSGSQFIKQASVGVSTGWQLTGNAGTTAGTNFIGTTDAKDFVTKTNNTERLRITSGGNVGIGTTTPDALLTIGTAVGAVSSALSVFKDYGASQIVGGGAVNIQTQTSVAQLTNGLTGLNLNTSTSHTSGSSNTFGLVNTTSQNGAGGSLTYLRGYQGAVNVSNGTTTYLEGMQVQNIISGNANVANYYGLHVSSGYTSSTVAVGNSIGVGIEDEAKSGAGSITNDYGLYISNIANGTSSNYSIYSNGGTMYHKGNIGINITAPAYPLDINATANPLRLQGLQAGASTDLIITSAAGVLRTQTAAQVVQNGITKTSVTSTFTVAASGEYLIPFTLTGTTQASIVAATYIATDVTGCSFSIPFLAGDGTGTVKVTNRTASAVTFTSLKVNFAVLSY